MRSTQLINILVLVSGLLVISGFAGAASSGIEWHSYEDGMARGKFEQKKIFLYFYADWCLPCKEMKKTTFQDPAIIGSLNEDFIPIKVDADREKETTLLYKVFSLPDIWFIAEDGQVIGHRPGYISVEQMKMILDIIAEQSQAQEVDPR